MKIARTAAEFIIPDLLHSSWSMDQDWQRLTKSLSFDEKPWNKNAKSHENPLFSSNLWNLDLMRENKGQGWETTKLPTDVQLFFQSMFLFSQCEIASNCFSIAACRRSNITTSNTDTETCGAIASTNTDMLLFFDIFLTSLSWLIFFACSPSPCWQNGLFWRLYAISSSEFI